LRFSDGVDIIIVDVDEDLKQADVISLINGTNRETISALIDLESAEKCRCSVTGVDKEEVSDRDVLIAVLLLDVDNDKEVELELSLISFCDDIDDDNVLAITASRFAEINVSVADDTRIEADNRLCEAISNNDDCEELNDNAVVLCSFLP